jgi:hypothetical protein
MLHLYTLLLRKTADSAATEKKPTEEKKGELKSRSATAASTKVFATQLIRYRT